ncbi:MAG: recombinase RecA [Oscillospiraceae bacterium]|jgi:recombination protein RecA|nr:recombinase RecA [Oscillospiraceae bacterium]
MAAKNSDKTKIVPVKKITDSDEKKKALDAAIAMIERTYGAGSVMRLGANTALNVDVIPTGSLTLDNALGIGGLPKGRIVEIYGPESSGKTTVALHAVAEAQKLGGIAAFIDVEHALDPIYAANLGVDTKELVVSQPDSGEQALEILESLIRSGAVDIIVLDSVAALTTKAEIDGLMGDAQMGALARLMSQAMRKLTSVISKSSCVAVFINQIREKIGVVYGNPETTTGGRALKFYASVRIEVRKGESIKDSGEILGSRTKCKVVKNKVAPPFKECEFDIIYGKGVSRLGELLDLAIEFNVIQKSGSWFSYGAERLAQGRDNTKELLQKNEALAKEVEEKVQFILKNRKDDPTLAPTAAPTKNSKNSKTAAAVVADQFEDEFDEFEVPDNA